MEKSKVIEKLFYYIVAFSYLLLPLSFIISKSKIKNTVPLLLIGYGIICCFFLLSFDSFSYEKQKYLQSAYTFFEYLVFAFIFWLNFTQPKMKKVIVILTIGFLAFQIFYLLSGKVKRIDTLPIGVETIIILFYIIYFFYQSSKDLSTEYVYNHYGFWISVGILLYLGGSFFFFILFDHLSRDQVETFGNLTYVTEIVKNILFSVAIFVYARHSFQSTKEKNKTIPFLDLDIY